MKFYNYFIHNYLNTLYFDQKNKNDTENNAKYDAMTQEDIKIRKIQILIYYSVFSLILCMSFIPIFNNIIFDNLGFLFSVVNVLLVIFSAVIHDKVIKICKSNDESNRTNIALILLFINIFVLFVLIIERLYIFQYNIYNLLLLIFIYHQQINGMIILLGLMIKYIIIIAIYIFRQIIILFIFLFSIITYIPYIIIKKTFFEGDDDTNMSFLEYNNFLIKKIMDILETFFEDL